jgi:hypothetical protein
VWGVKNPVLSKPEFRDKKKYAVELNNWIHDEHGHILLLSSFGRGKLPKRILRIVDYP